MMPILLILIASIYWVIYWNGSYDSEGERECKNYPYMSYCRKKRDIITPSIAYSTVTNSLMFKLLLFLTGEWNVFSTKAKRCKCNV